MIDSNASASAPEPVPFAIARSMLSLGTDAWRAFSIAVASAALPAGSPPPSRAATWIARASFVKSCPRLASVAFFLCLIEAHLEWPATAPEFRRRLDREAAVDLEVLAVDRDAPALAQVADHVPVDRRVVHAAGFGIRLADGHVDRAADLLVEQDLARAGGDPVVRSDAELAQAACAVVGVEHLDQVALALRRRGVHDLAALEAELHAGDLASAVDGREAEGDLALDRVFDRAREELPVGHVVLAGARDPGAPGDVQLHVGAGARDVDLLLALDPLGQALRLRRSARPRGHRVVVGREARLVIEVLVLGQRQSRLAGQAVG